MIQKTFLLILFTLVMSPVSSSVVLAGGGGADGPDGPDDSHTTWSLSDYVGPTGNSDRGTSYASQEDAEAAARANAVNGYENSSVTPDAVLTIDLNTGVITHTYTGTFSYSNSYRSGPSGPSVPGGPSGPSVCSGDPRACYEENLDRCSRNMGNTCYSSANSCSVQGSGTYNCAGVCSAAVPANPAGYGSSCSVSNVCGATNYGSQTCSGSCSVGAPALPALYGQTCGSGPNVCGMRNTGTYNCASTCTVPTTPPSDSLCPGPGGVGSSTPNSGGVIDLDTLTPPPTCDARVGSSCTKQNTTCGLEARGYVGCDGSCNAIYPFDSFCVAPEPASIITCQSDRNSCNQFNTVQIRGNSSDACPVVPAPSESSCGIPTLGLRTQDGRNIVREGGVKTLVWDQVNHATECRLSGGGLNQVYTNYQSDQSVTPWVNRMPGNYQETNAITVSTNYTLQCRNGSGPWVRDSLRITILPEIKEN